MCGATIALILDEVADPFMGLGCMGLSFGYGPATDRRDAVRLIRAVAWASPHIDAAKGNPHAKHTPKRP